MDQCQETISNDEVGEPPPRSHELGESFGVGKLEQQASELSPIAERDGEEDGQEPEERSQPGRSGFDLLSSHSFDLSKLDLEGGSEDGQDTSGQRHSHNAENSSQRGARPSASFVPTGRLTEGLVADDQSSAPIYMNDSFNEGGNASSPAEDVSGQNGNTMQPGEAQNSAEGAQLPVRAQLALHDSYLAGQVRASSSYAAGPGAEASGPGAGSQGSALGRFHWTMLMPVLYTALLLYMACLAGYFSLSGICFFVLFIMHSYAYYGFRGKYTVIRLHSTF